MTFGIKHRIEFDFFSTEPHGYIVEVESNGIVAFQRLMRGANQWWHETFDFVPNYSASGMSVMIRIFNEPRGGSVGFSIDNIKISRL